MKHDFQSRVPFLVLISLRNETMFFEHSYFPMSSSLKKWNKSPSNLSLWLGLIEVELSLSLDLINKPSFHPFVSNEQYT